MNKHVGRRIPRPDSIILHFNKGDSQIVRNWAGAKVKDIFDDKD